jgi:hypothetical protein
MIRIHLDRASRAASTRPNEASKALDAAPTLSLLNTIDIETVKGSLHGVGHKRGHNDPQNDPGVMQTKPAQQLNLKLNLKLSLVLLSFVLLNIASVCSA